MSSEQQKQPCAPPPQLQQQQVKLPCQPPPQEPCVPKVPEPCHPKVPEPCHPKVPEPCHPKVPEPCNPTVPDPCPPTVTPAPAQQKTKQKNCTQREVGYSQKVPDPGTAKYKEVNIINVPQPGNPKVPEPGYPKVPDQGQNKYPQPYPLPVTPGPDQQKTKQK
uniref:Uncharacterized protein n=1 Tax=Loxodonta africana TaxID=9785 RepID=G3TFM6_LOXAF